MRRQDINDLLAFLAVAREGSFTKAAAKLGVSQSALSHTMRGLEERLGVRLLTRTTRKVSATAAGERLLRNLGPRFEEIEAELDALSELREKPAVPSASRPASMPLSQSSSLHWQSFFPVTRTSTSKSSSTMGSPTSLPSVTMRVCGSASRSPRDMIAVRIGPDMRMAVVGAPSYFASRPKPKKPQHLTAHQCINLRLPTFGGLYAWEFEKRGHELKVRVEGQLVFNNLALRLKSALAGLGLAYLPEDQVRTHVADGRLVQVLDDWCPAFSGYHLYYPNRRQLTPAFGLLVDALRYRS